MTESPASNAATTAATKAATSAAAKAAKAVAASEALPKVVETTELALEVPAKVVLGQKTVFTIGVVSGAALGVGILFGAKKLRDYMKNRKADEKIDENIHDETDHI